MPVMQVRKMRMKVHEHFMAVRVRVLFNWHTVLVSMFMMSIMSVPVLVHGDFVNMFVPMLLSQMQPKSEAHETARYD
jgi:hypothetical protein